jgi:prevent-host-death family protein
MEKRMLEVGAVEAQNTFSLLLDRAEAGQETVITRDGRPVARLTPTPDFTISSEQRQAARAAMIRIRQRAASSRCGHFNWDEWKAYRDEGRR